jgi:MFS family permease
MMKNYKKTKLACYLGFITQAVAANFAPLLFLKFHTDYNISLGNIAMISTSFFFTQLLVDLFCAKYVDKIGYRVCIVASEVCSAAGFVGLAFLPEIIPSPFIGIIISVILYAIGSVPSTSKNAILIILATSVRLTGYIPSAVLLSSFPSFHKSALLARRGCIS